MKHIKLYEEYTTKPFLTNRDDIIEWLSKHILGYEHITDLFNITKDGVVNISSIENYIMADTYSLDIKDFEGDHLPVQFGEVYCDFNISRLKLKSLKGSPSLTLNFNANHNYITSLEYCPKNVLGSFNVSYNPIVYVDNNPEQVYGKYVDRDTFLYTANLEETLLIDSDCSRIKYTPIYKTYNKNDIKEVCSKFLDMLHHIYNPDLPKKYSIYWDYNKIDLSSILSQIEKYLPKHYEYITSKENDAILSGLMRKENASQHIDIMDL